MVSTYPKCKYLPKGETSTANLLGLFSTAVPWLSLLTCTSTDVSLLLSPAACALTTESRLMQGVLDGKDTENGVTALMEQEGLALFDTNGKVEQHKVEAAIFILKAKDFKN